MEKGKSKEWKQAGREEGRKGGSEEEKEKVVRRSEKRREGRKCIGWKWRWGRGRDGNVEGKWKRGRG